MRLLLAAFLAAPVHAGDFTLPEGVSVQFSKTPRDAIAARVEKFSASMLGVPYKLGPLGEGPDGEYDSDPLVDLSAVDCMTYVEEVLALSRAKDQAGLMDELRRVRYRDGVIEYAHRNHFTDADWLPNNIKEGFIRDLTRDAAGADYAVLSKAVSKKTWYEKKTVKDLEGEKIRALGKAEKDRRVAKLKTLGKDMPDENVSIGYLPIGALAARQDKIPSGTIVSLVRGNDDVHDTMVSHMGLIVRVKGKAYFREASSDQHKVVDVPLLEYFKIYRNSKWPLLGLNLAVPAEN